MARPTLIKGKCGCRMNVCWIPSRFKVQNSSAMVNGKEIKKLNELKLNQFRFTPKWFQFQRPKEEIPSYRIWENQGEHSVSNY